MDDAARAEAVGVHVHKLELEGYTFGRISESRLQR